MTRMRVLKKRFPYAKQTYVRGDEFNAQDKDVKILLLAGIAELMEADVAKPKRQARSAGNIKKAGEAKRSTKAKKAPSKRTYQRRDMQAEK